MKTRHWILVLEKSRKLSNGEAKFKTKKPEETGCFNATRMTTGKSTEHSFYCLASTRRGGTQDEATVRRAVA